MLIGILSSTEITCLLTGIYRQLQISLYLPPNSFDTSRIPCKIRLFNCVRSGGPFMFLILEEHEKINPVDMGFAIGGDRWQSDWLPRFSVHFGGGFSVTWREEARGVKNFGHGYSISNGRICFGWWIQKSSFPFQSSQVKVVGTTGVTSTCQIYYVRLVSLIHLLLRIIVCFGALFLSPLC